MKRHQSNREKPGPPKRVLTAKGRKPHRNPNRPLPDPLTAAPEDFATASAESLLPMVRRALELQGLKFPLWEIAEALQREFKLSKAPSEATIWRWCEEAREAYMHDIKALTAREIASQLLTCDNMLRTWLPRAMDGMAIIRGRMKDGEYVEEIDERAFGEKQKAATVVAKYLEIRSDILGIKNGAGLPKEGGEKTADQLQAFILKIASEAVSSLPSVKGQTIEPKRATLTLESGVEELHLT